MKSAAQDAKYRSRGFEDGSGNVFEDLGLPDAASALVKARLADAIADAIQHIGLTQVEAARLLGIDQPKVSRIVNGSLAGFSQERLLRFLQLLGSDVEITVGAAVADRTGRMTVRRVG